MFYDSSGWVAIHFPSYVQPPRPQIRVNKLYSSEGKAKAAVRKQYGNDSAEQCMYIELSPTFLLQMWEAQQKEKRHGK